MTLAPSEIQRHKAPKCWSEGLGTVWRLPENLYGNPYILVLFHIPNA